MAAKLFVLAFAAVIWKAESQQYGGSIFRNPLRSSYGPLEAQSTSVFEEPLSETPQDRKSSPFSPDLSPSLPCSQEALSSSLPDANELFDKIFSKTPQQLFYGCVKPTTLGVGKNILSESTQFSATKESLTNLKGFNTPMLRSESFDRPSEEIEASSRSFSLTQPSSIRSNRPFSSSPVNNLGKVNVPNLKELSTPCSSTIESPISSFRPEPPFSTQTNSFWPCKKTKLEPEDTTPASKPSVAPFKPLPTSCGSKSGLGSLGSRIRPISPEIPKFSTVSPSNNPIKPSQPSSYSKLNSFKQCNSKKSESQPSVSTKEFPRPIKSFPKTCDTQLGLVKQCNKPVIEQEIFSPIASFRPQSSSCEFPLGVPWYGPKKNQLPPIKPKPSSFPCGSKVGSYEPQINSPIIEDIPKPCPAPKAPSPGRLPSSAGIVPISQRIQMQRSFPFMTLNEPPYVSNIESSAISSVSTPVFSSTSTATTTTAILDSGIENSLSDSVQFMNLNGGGQSTESYAPQYFPNYCNMPRPSAPQSNSVIQTQLLQSETCGPFTNNNQFNSISQNVLGPNNFEINPSFETNPYRGQNYLDIPEIDSVNYGSCISSSTANPKSNVISNFIYADGSSNSDSAFNFNPTDSLTSNALAVTADLESLFGYFPETTKPVNIMPPEMFYSNPCDSNYWSAPSSSAMPILSLSSSLNIDSPNGFTSNSCNNFGNLGNLSPQPINYRPVNMGPLRDICPTSDRLREILSCLPSSVEITGVFAPSNNEIPLTSLPSEIVTEASASVSVQPNIPKVPTPIQLSTVTNAQNPNLNYIPNHIEASSSAQADIRSIPSVTTTNSMYGPMFNQLEASATTDTSTQVSTPPIYNLGSMSNQIQATAFAQADINSLPTVSSTNISPNQLQTTTYAESSIKPELISNSMSNQIQETAFAQADIYLLPTISSTNINPTSNQLQTTAYAESSIKPEPISNLSPISSQTEATASAEANIRQGNVFNPFSSQSQPATDVYALASAQNSFSPGNLNEISEYTTSFVPVEMVDTASPYSSNFFSLSGPMDPSLHYTIAEPITPPPQSVVSVTEASNSFSSTTGQATSTTSSAAITETSSPIPSLKIVPEIINSLPIEIFLPITVFPSITESIPVMSLPLSENLYPETMSNSFIAADAESSILYEAETISPVTLQGYTEIPKEEVSITSSASTSTDITTPTSSASTSSISSSTVSTSTVDQTAPLSQISQCIPSTTSSNLYNFDFSPMFFEIEIPSSIGSSSIYPMFGSSCSSPLPMYELQIPSSIPAQIGCSLGTVPSTSPAIFMNVEPYNSNC